jgi:hypothetical protein
MKTFLKTTASLLCLLAGEALGAGFTATWNANPEPDIHHYTLYVRHPSGAVVAKGVTNATSTTYSSVAAGDTVEVWVTATSNALLESGPSAKLTYWAPAPPPPVAVTRLQPAGVSGTNWTGFRVEWTASASATSYTLAATPSAGAAPPVTATTTNTSHTFPTLPIATYTFAVTARNAAGSSAPGPTLTISHVPPGNPLNLRVMETPALSATSVAAPK